MRIIRSLVPLRTLILSSVAMALVTALTSTSGHAAGRDLRVVQAAKAQRGAALKALIGQKADVNAAEPDGATALHWAAHWNDLTAATLLVAAGARADALNDFGVSPLSLAATNGSAAMLELLLKAGAGVNGALPSGETALMTASRTGNVDAVKALLAHGADVNAKENAMGQTALMWAISEGHLDVARTLLDGGANVKAASASGFTPLLFAVREGSLDGLKLMLDKGATVNEASSDGMTALHVAVIRGHVSLAKFLLERGANPNASGTGYTPLHWVAGTWESIQTHDYIFNPTAVNEVKEWRVLAGIPTLAEKHDLIRALLARGADINARMTKSPPRYGFTLFKTPYIIGATPLFLAAQVGDAPTMRLLLANGADPALGANDKTTLLMVSAGIARVDTESSVPEKSYFDAVALTLGLGEDVNASNAAGLTALHAAAMAGFDRVVQLLADSGASLSLKSKDGLTPLKLAIEYVNDAMVYTRPSTAALLRKLGASE